MVSHVVEAASGKGPVGILQGRGGVEETKSAGRQRRIRRRAPAFENPVGAENTADEGVESLCTEAVRIAGTSAVSKQKVDLTIVQVLCLPDPRFHLEGGEGGCAN